jgi:DNA-directed RNA polymerase specialized sigma24 family protein
MAPLSRPDQVPTSEETYEALFRRESRRLVRLAYALSGSRLAADDIAQEALLAAYKGWEEVGRLDNPGAWARRVVANKSVSVFRKRRERSRSSSRLSRSPQPRPVWSLEANVAVIPVERDREMEWPPEWHGRHRGRGGWLLGSGWIPS